jgi:pyruvate dehydrogenase E1 component
VPVCRSYDPAFAFELALIIRHGLACMYPGDGSPGEDVFYYLTVYNETYPMPPMPADPEGEVLRGVIDGLYRWHPAPAGDGPEATILFSGTSWAAAVEARDVLAGRYGVRASLWSATSYQQLRQEALAVERANRLHPGREPSVPLVTRLLSGSAGPIVAVSDFMRAVPDQISRFVPAGRPWLSLGTDGYGRSDTREALRRFFETDTAHVVLAVLSQLAVDGRIDPAAAVAAIGEYGLDPGLPPPWTH